MSYATNVEHYLHKHIPLSKAMGITVDSASREDRIVVLPAS